MDRREFISSGAGTATAVALAAHAGASRASPLLRGAPPSTLNRAGFERWLNSSFELRRVGTLRVSRAQLIAVRDGQRAPGLEQFHVLWRGDGAAIPGLCELRHESGATLRLWLDVAGKDGAAPLMRATFSLIDM
jgi:hypothetical protein